MRFWWVNQNQTFKHEFHGRFLWSPKRKSNGHANPFYDTMTRVQPGDVVFSFAGGQIRAIGVARTGHQTAPKPDFGGAGSNWSEEGWLVEVDYALVQTPVRPKDFFDVIRPTLPLRYSPLDAHGNGVQSVYLAEVPAVMATALIGLLGADYDNTLAIIGASDRANDVEGNVEQRKIEERTDISNTQKETLIRARVGQGVFKSNVRLRETHCRVTGLELPQHLIASHIKPWKASTDSEKIDGSNGFLMSPHVDHLFDRGYMSFESNGNLVISPKLQYRVLAVWHINQDLNVGEFSERQKKYLKYHRENVFQTAS